LRIFRTNPWRYPCHFTNPLLCRLGQTVTPAAAKSESGQPPR
jgi:hypothetical protein